MIRVAHLYFEMRKFESWLPGLSVWANTGSNPAAPAGESGLCASTAQMRANIALITGRRLR
jgi:hypothetical protein